MKISGINHGAINPSPATRPAALRSPMHTGSKVAVSQEAKKLAEARAPAVSDAGKIARITAAIARGDFMVDADRIADNMIKEER